MSSVIETEVIRRSATRIEDVALGAAFLINGLVYLRIRDCPDAIAQGRHKALILSILDEKVESDRGTVPYNLSFIKSGTFVMPVLEAKIRIEI